MKRFAMMMQLVGALAMGCGEAAPGTSIQVSLTYDDGLGLETADVTLASRTESGRIAHELLLLVPDELAGANMPIEVWARKDGKRAAFGTASAVPRLGSIVPASLVLRACTPACQGSMLSTCTGPMVACTLGCSEDGDAHCVGLKPSNGVERSLADPLRGTVTISATTTFDTDSGAIIGGLDRAAGDGVQGGIGYFQAAAVASGGAPLGIFVFRNLTIEAAATVRFTGARAAVLLVGDVAKIAGTVDVSASAPVRSVPGPGGGAGGTATTAAQGCGAGGPGKKGTVTISEDSGGGGGGAGTAGGAGGDSFTVSPATPGGKAGVGCLPDELEPLQGGSGGGTGSPGTSGIFASGGGGGGALQITALGSLEITGRIHAGGAGGSGGPLSTEDAGSGAGGGSGGAILLEAPTVLVGSGAVLAANGGGGGSSGTNTVASEPGANANASAIPAAGGLAVLTNASSGGDGGARGAAPQAGELGTANAGGGGGAVGKIVVRGRVVMLEGTSSPAATTLDVRR